VVGMFGAGERPTGTRDPFALRRNAQGLLRVLVDLPELTGLDAAPTIDALVWQAVAFFEMPVDKVEERKPATESALDDRREWERPLTLFLLDRLRFLFEKRGYAHDEITAVLPASATLKVAPLDIRRRLEALRAMRGSEDFEALAVAFKRVKNITRDLPAGGSFDPAVVAGASDADAAERELASELASRGPGVREAAGAGDYRRAFTAAAGFRAAVDRFFTDVLVMHDNPQIRDRRLRLVAALRDLVLGLADISEVAADAPRASAP
jgi:glycyl-tRNA synthetase beta chain